MTQDIAPQTVDPIVAEIDDALVVHGISKTRFGYICAGDPALVRKLRDGRRPRPAMVRSIRELIGRLERGDVL